MTKTPNKGITLASGFRLSNGQLFPPAGNLARDGGRKNFKIARREHGIHPEAGDVVGLAQVDHPTAEKGVPAHDGMSFHTIDPRLGKVQVVGFSRTEFDSAKLVTSPTVEKKLDPVVVKAGMSTAAQRSKPRGSAD
jgi:hypothetical protein